MTDDQLIEFLGLGQCTPEQQAKVLRSLTVEKRALYDHMAEVETQLNLWQCGLGPRPKDVIICGEVHAMRRGRRRRRGMHRG